MLERGVFTRLLDEVGTFFPENIRRSMFNQDYHRNLEIIKFISPIMEKPFKVLDIGIGPGIASLVLSKMGINVTGFDTWEEYASEYNNRSGEKNDIINRLKDHGVEIRFHNLSETLPFETDSFDVVLFLDVIEHLPGSPGPVLKEIYRLLKPGGYLIVTTPNMANLRNRVIFSFGKSHYLGFKDSFSSAKYFGHNREYTFDEMVFMLRESGFTIFSSKLSNCWQIYTQIDSNQYDKKFRLNSLRQIVMLGYLFMTYLIPKTKFYMLLMARKENLKRPFGELNGPQ
jgi:SAM-dependent methyltransferase